MADLHIPQSDGDAAAADAAAVAVAFACAGLWLKAWVRVQGSLYNENIA